MEQVTITLDANDLQAIIEYLVMNKEIAEDMARKDGSAEAMDEAQDLERIIQILVKQRA